MRPSDPSMSLCCVLRLCCVHTVLAMSRNRSSRRTPSSLSLRRVASARAAPTLLSMPRIVPCARRCVCVCLHASACCCRCLLWFVVQSITCESGTLPNPENDFQVSSDGDSRVSACGAVIHAALLSMQAIIDAEGIVHAVECGNDVCRKVEQPTEKRKAGTTSGARARGYQFAFFCAIAAFQMPFRIASPFP